MQYRGPADRSDVNERVVSLNRVAKVVKGGRRFSFSALIVVGDLQGRVGAGLGKASEVPEAIRKGVEIAKRNMITVPMVGTTIPHEVRYKWGAARIMLKPAAPGTGVISGGAMRAVIELAGIKDILTKSLGTNNPINTVRATMAALQSIRTAQEVADLRGKSIEDIVGRRLARAYRSAAEVGTIGNGATPDTEARPEAPADSGAASSPRSRRDGGEGGRPTPTEPQAPADSAPSSSPRLREGRVGGPATPAEPEAEAAPELPPEPLADEPTAVEAEGKKDTSPPVTEAQPESPAESPAKDDK